MAKIETSGCRHARHDSKCVWCAARKIWGADRVVEIAAEYDDGYAFVSVAGERDVVMLEEGTGGVWRMARPSFSNAV